MRLTILHSFLILFLLITACKKETANRISTENLLPANIIYQNFDTTTNSFITTQSYKLYQDTNHVYLDSFGLQFNTNPFVTFPLNYSLYNSRKYVRGTDISNDQGFVIKFDNTDRVFEIHDGYSISADATTSEGDWSNNEIRYTNFPAGSILSHFASIGVFSSIADLSYNFDVIDANNDSMKVVSGLAHDLIGVDRTLKYTIFFDTSDNKTNLMQLSGYMFEPYQVVYTRVSNLFNFMRFMPMPKLNMKLAKSIYITESLGISMYLKAADFTYEYDNQNRVTKADINYYVNGLFSGYPNVTQRILINY